MARRMAQTGTLAGLPCLVAGPVDATPLAILPGLSPEQGIGAGPLSRAELSLAQEFAGRFRVTWLAWRPNANGSPRAPGMNGNRAGPSMAAVAAQYAAALREAGAEDAPLDVMGISTGGSIALQLAADHPQLVRRLVLVSAAARLGAVARAEQQALAQRIASGDRRGAFARLVADLVPNPLPWADGRRAAVHARAAALVRPPLAATGWMLGPLLWPQAGDMRALAALIEAEDGYDLRERLNDVRAPTLVIAGGRDPYYDEGAFEQVARGVRDGRLVRFAQRGHVTVATDPRFARTVARFLREER